jgi:hypothetical protein
MSFFEDIERITALVGRLHRELEQLGSCSPFVSKHDLEQMEARLLKAIKPDADTVYGPEDQRLIDKVLNRTWRQVLRLETLDSNYPPKPKEENDSEPKSG